MDYPAIIENLGVAGIAISGACWVIKFLMQQFIDAQKNFIDFVGRYFEQQESFSRSMLEEIRQLRKELQRSNDLKDH